MRAERTKPVFIYDGDCGVCQRFVRFLGRGSRGSILFEPFQSLELARYGVSEVEASNSAFFVAETKVYSKSDAIAMALKEQRSYLLQVIGMVLHVRPIRPLARMGYTVFARNRNLWPGPVACSIENKS